MVPKPPAPARPEVFFDEAAYAPPAFEPFRTQTWSRSAAEWDRVERARVLLDPITIDVVEGALDSAIDEAEAGVERTARSSLIREQHDFRASVNTVDCESVTRVSFAATADPIREHFPLDDIHPGDAFIFNDPYESHGTISQLPDLSVVVPVFADGARPRLLADLWPPLRCRRSSQRQPAAELDEHLRGRPSGATDSSLTIGERSTARSGSSCCGTRDFRTRFEQTSTRSSARRGSWNARIGELVERKGADIVEAAMYELIDRCARTMRDVVLPKLPDGEFMGEDFADNDNIDLEQPVRFQVALKKDPEKIILDWSGTNAQTPGPINWLTNGRYVAKWLGAFFKAFDPGMVVNEGVTQALKCYIPPGTVMSPAYPAAVSNRMPTMLRAVSAYRVALARAFGGQTVADFNCAQLYGFYGETDGEPFLFREAFGAGSGARPFADGTDAVDMVPNSKNLPAEFIEQRFPVTVERVGLDADSAGAGLFRGGFGYLKDLRVLVDGHFMSTAERTGFGPWGVNGGKAGRPGGLTINPGTAEERRVRFRHEATPVRAGDIVRIVTSGGGGFGDPLERDVDAVRLDVLRRLVSVRSAADDYGVIVRPIEGEVLEYAVDATATTALRDELRDSRSRLRLIDRGSYAAECLASGTISFEDDELHT